MPLSWTEISFLCMAIGFVVLVAFLVSFLKRIQKTLADLESFLAGGKNAINSTISEIVPAIRGLGELEADTRVAVKEVERRLSLVEDEVAPLLHQLRGAVDTYQELGKSLERRIERDIPPILENVNRISADVSGLSGDIRDKIHKTDEFFHAIGEAGATVHAVTGITRKGLMGLAVQIASMTTGMRTTLEYISENLTRKGEKRQ